MVPFLEAEHRGQSPAARPARTARVQVISHENSGSGNLIEMLVDIDSLSVTEKKHLVGKHSYIDSAYMQAVERACRADPRIEAEIQKLKLPEGATVVIESWAYATDGMNNMSERTTMVRISRPRKGTAGVLC